MDANSGGMPIYVGWLVQPPVSVHLAEPATNKSACEYATTAIEVAREVMTREGIPIDDDDRTGAARYFGRKTLSDLD